jgi:hypothetical protein
VERRKDERFRKSRWQRGAGDETVTPMPTGQHLGVAVNQQQSDRSFKFSVA